VRVPGWADRIDLRSPDQGVLDASAARGESLAIDRTGSSRWGKYFRLTPSWSGTKTLVLRVSMPTRLFQGDNNAVAIERGPLVYALPIQAEWKKLRDRPNLPFDDWEVYPKSPWNYALQIDRGQPERSVVFEEKAVGESPFSPAGAPMIARVKGRRVVAWGLERGAAAPPPSSPVTSNEPLEELTLVPYGCTDLRVTEFPTLPSR
jgi:hypothetical protein